MWTSALERAQSLPSPSRGLPSVSTPALRRAQSWSSPGEGLSENYMLNESGRKEKRATSPRQKRKLHKQASPNRPSTHAGFTRIWTSALTRAFRSPSSSRSVPRVFTPALQQTRMWAPLTRGLVELECSRREARAPTVARAQRHAAASLAKGA